MRPMIDDSQAFLASLTRKQKIAAIQELKLLPYSRDGSQALSLNKMTDPCLLNVLLSFQQDPVKYRIKMNEKSDGELTGSTEIK